MATKKSPTVADLSATVAEQGQTLANLTALLEKLVAAPAQAAAPVDPRKVAEDARAPKLPDEETACRNASCKLHETSGGRIGVKIRAEEFHDPTRRSGSRKLMEQYLDAAILRAVLDPKTPVGKAVRKLLAD